MGPIVRAFDMAFDEISKGSRNLISRTPPDTLFKDSRPYGSTAMCSIGEYIVRSGAMVERAFGGLTRRLWDDPFEWTLPEELYSVHEIGKYLDDVDASRKSGLLFLCSDDDLSKQVPAPQSLKSIAEILIGAVAESRHYQGRAFALYQITCDRKLPVV